MDRIIIMNRYDGRRLYKPFWTNCENYIEIITKFFETKKAWKEGIFLQPRRRVVGVLDPGLGDTLVLAPLGAFSTVLPRDTFSDDGLFQ